MSVLSTLALRMVTQEGPERCRKICEKLRKLKGSSNIGNVVDEDDSGTRGDDGNRSKSAKRRLRKKKLKENSSQANGSECDTKTAGQVESEGEVDMRAYDLVCLAEKRAPNDFFERTLMAVFILKGLQTVQFFQNSSKLDGEY